METTRQKKFARSIQKELAGLLQHDLPELNGLLVTVQVVKVSPDLKIARCYLTSFPEPAIKKVIEFLESEPGRIRYELGKKLKDVVRAIPELEFYEDETGPEAARVEKLLESVRGDWENKDEGNDNEPEKAESDSEEA